jgi:thioredoxin-like negative regulator of GroEL
LLVVCLCAAWCHVCEQYRSTFNQVQASVQADFPQVSFVWLDIEDESEVLDPLDVENFPTILMSLGRAPRFFGTITPQPQTLERLVRMALQDPTATPLANSAVSALVARVEAWRRQASQPGS